MKQLRDLGLMLLLFAVLVAFTIWGPGRNQADTQGVRGSTHSIQDDGSRGLQLWLDSLGYRTGNLEYTEWQVPATTDALFMVATDKEPVTKAQSDAILRWVQDGGTLISVLEQPTRPLAPDSLWSALGASVIVSTTKQLPVAERAEAVQPLLTTPPVASVAMETANSIALAEADTTDPSSTGFVTLLQTRYGPSLVGRQYERGYVFLGASAQPFTNGGLKQPGSGPLILNLIGRVPVHGHILFDEFHHGFHAAPSAGGLLTTSWWGWALIYTLLVVTLYLILSGKRFGRPLVMRQELARRSSAEYVTSMAQLLRRAGKRHEMAEHYHTQLKRRLAQPYGFAPPVDDEQFISELQRWGNLDDDQITRLRPLLGRLHEAKPSEADLLAMARSSTQLVDRKGRLQ
ncbi:MAG: DUF4350 domain-containing protein [Herpetosiphonaceae bacterium]|nr:DUF4350 domain-containing protein [Herpetosiphonaceae bacterium]